MKTPNAATIDSHAAVRLDAIPRGTSVVVTRVRQSAEALRLREFGFGEGRRISIVAAADPIICRIDRARVAIARRLAELIHVRPVPAPSSERIR